MRSPVKAHSALALVGLILLVSSSAADTRKIPAMMLAAAIDHGGGPEVLSIHRVPVPKPGVGEVLIAVQAAGLGPWEAGMRQHPGAGVQFPLVLGSDGAGTIAALGSGVRDFKVGDQVYGSSDAFDAEYVIAASANVARVPMGIDGKEAGILAISGLSALQAVDEVLRLKAGETLIIHGATGGVGTLAVQFAKLRGVKVLATASSADGLALVSRLGADAVVNGRTGDIAAAAQQFAPNGVDAVLGLAGGDELERCIDSLRKDGHGRVAYLYGLQPLPKPRYGISMTLFSYVSGRQELAQLNHAVEAAKLQVPIAAEFPLAEVAMAHMRLEAGHLIGKILIDVPGSASSER